MEMLLFTEMSDVVPPATTKKSFIIEEQPKLLGVFVNQNDGL